VPGAYHRKHLLALIGAVRGEVIQWGLFTEAELAALTSALVRFWVEHRQLHDLSAVAMVIEVPEVAGDLVERSVAIMYPTTLSRRSCSLTQGADWQLVVGGRVSRAGADIR